MTPDLSSVTTQPKVGATLCTVDSFMVHSKPNLNSYDESCVQRVKLDAALCTGSNLVLNLDPKSNPKSDLGWAAEAGGCSAARVHSSVNRATNACATGHKNDVPFSVPQQCMPSHNAGQHPECAHAAVGIPQFHYGTTAKMSP